MHTQGIGLSIMVLSGLAGVVIGFFGNDMSVPEVCTAQWLIGVLGGALEKMLL